MSLGAPDKSGRAAPRPMPGSEFTLAADQIVKAIGQQKLVRRKRSRLHNGKRILASQ